MSTTPIAGPIVPQNNAPFETHRAALGKGGWRSVVDTTERDNIPVWLREAGMAVMVLTAAVGEAGPYTLNADLTTWSPLTAAGDFRTVPDVASLPTTGVVDGNAAITADTGLWRQVFGGTWQSAFVVQTLLVTGDTEIDGAANVGAYNFIVGKAIAPFAAYSSGTIVLGASGGPGSFRLAPSAYQSFGYLRTAADGTLSRTLTLGSATFPVTVNANAITIHNYNDDSTPSLAQIDYDSGTALWLGDPSLAMVLKASGTIKTDQSFEPFTTSTFGYGLKYNYSSSLGGVTAISWDSAYTYGGSVAPTSIIFGDTGTTYGTGLRNTVRLWGSAYQTQSGKVLGIIDNVGTLGPVAVSGSSVAAGTGISVGVAGSVYTVSFDSSSSPTLAALKLGSTVASAGDLRLANGTTAIAFRNQANTADVVVAATDTSNNLYFGGSSAGANGPFVTYLQGAAGVIIRQASSNLMLMSTSNIQAYINRFAFVSTLSSCVISQDTQSSDVATSDLTVASQAPFATATGTNRNPGNLVLSVPSPIAGGTAGKVQLKVSGTSVVDVASTLVTVAQPVSIGSTVATTGSVRLPNAVDGVVFRNGANTANVTGLALNSSNQLLVGGPGFSASRATQVFVDAATDVQIQNGGVARITANATGIGFFNATPIAKPSITGALSSVTDANAKAVLTSIITAQANLGLATNSTT
jgi:hypothetical protein